MINEKDLNELAGLYEKLSTVASRIDAEFCGDHRSKVTLVDSKYNEQVQIEIDLKKRLQNKFDAVIQVCLEHEYELGWARTDAPLTAEEEKIIDEVIDDGWDSVYRYVEKIRSKRLN